jgi:HEAT repeat protein
MSFVGHASAQDARSSAVVETELLDVLRSDAPPADKALVCKQLAVHGSAASVGELAKLLPDEQLSSWARIAIEAIPGDEANQALREAAQQLDGLLLVGMLNSIGVRRDADSISVLADRLDHTDDSVAAAAAVALGKIAAPEAVQLLRTELAAAPRERRSAVAEACVYAAEQLARDGDLATAVELYDAVRGAEVPMQRIVEATRGSILARQNEGLPLLLETLNSTEKKLFQLGLATAREFPGGDVDLALAEALPTMAPERGALVVQAMADRPQTVRLDAIVNAAESASPVMRLSAIDAMRRVGDDTCLPILLDLAGDEDAEMAQAARRALTELPGERVNQRIVEQLKTADERDLPLLLQLVAGRRIDAVDEVLPALKNPEATIRHAALGALGETVKPARLTLLISQFVQPTNAEDVEVARTALRAASVRMPDRDECVDQLATALDRSRGETRVSLLEIVGDVGGGAALQTLAKSARSEDDSMRDAASRLLGRWNSVDAAPVLLDLAKTGPSEKYRVRALRGYLGVARKFAMPEKQRVEMCAQAINNTRREAEQNLALEVLQIHPSIEGLRLTLKQTENAKLKSSATAAALVIAQKLSGEGVDVSQLMNGVGLAKVELEIISAVYGAEGSTKDVTEMLRKQAGDSPLITLSAGYNKVFGGDPAPGTPKKLQVKYRIDGKTGEASFEENALLILPPGE